MNRLVLMIATAVIVGCDEPAAPVTPSRPLQQEPTFIVFGSVRDSARVPIAGAIAEITTGVYRGMIAIANDSGYFSLAGVQGSMNIRIWRDGYGPQLRSLRVTSDMPFEVTLARVEYSDTIVFGKTVRSFVLSGHQPCDYNWDAQAPCRSYIIKPPVSGWLTVSIAWHGDPELDATIVSSRRVYLAYSGPPVNETVALTMYVVAGENYELRVQSYYGTQFFDLTTDITAQPTGG